MGTANVAHARVDSPGASCCGSHAYDEGVNAESPNGHHFRPWRYPVRTGVEHRSMPASHQPLQGVAGVPRAPGGYKLKLLDQVREAIRMRHYSVRTEEAYVRWIKRFTLFHGKRHPLEMGADEITRFLSALAVQGHVSASTPKSGALCADLSVPPRPWPKVGLGRRCCPRQAPSTSTNCIDKIRDQSAVGRFGGCPLDHGQPLIWGRPAPSGVFASPSEGY
jgi:hypothetical protein